MTTDLAELAYQMHTSLDLTDHEEVEKFNGLGFKRIAGHYMAIHRLPMFMWTSNDTVELGPKGIVPWGGDKTKPGLHITYGGTPHHVPHGYGYWHINDVDEIYLWAPAPSPNEFMTLVIVERDRLPGERDMFAWYCQQCQNLLYCYVYESGDNAHLGFEGSVSAELKAVRTFNGDRELRLCNECGAEHPLAYRLIGLPADTQAEEQARFVW